MSAYQSRADGDERVFAVIAHLSAIIAMVISAGWLSILGPFVVWLIARNNSSYVRRAAAGAFNFNLWVWLLAVVGWICAFTVIGLPVAVVLWAVSGLLTVICHCWGAWRAAHGQEFRYPAQIRILR